MVSAFHKLRQVYQIKHDFFWMIIIYGVVISLFSLAIPISVQTLINVVSFGASMQPVIVLTVVLFVVLSVIATIRVAQSMIVETVQQHVFVSVGLKLARFLPNVNLHAYDECRISELGNYFFEVQTIQKSLAKLLVSGIEIVLVSFFSMLLVAFYHPLLLVLDVLLIITMALSILLPWKKALQYAMKECEAKHRVASWLEEILHNILLFKLDNHADYAVEVADEKISDYLKARKLHFKNILKHMVSINAIYVIANTALLGVGGYLVIHEQLSLGQLVASELIINAMLYGFVRVSFYMEDLYDMLASGAKMDTLLTISSEQKQLEKEKSKPHTAITELPSFEVKGLTYHDESKEILFDQLNFSLEPGKQIVICGEKNTGKRILVDILLGLRRADQGIVRVNGVPIQDYDITKLRKQAALVREIEIFSGSVLDNIVLHRKDISLERIHSLLNKLNLELSLEHLPEGLNTFISASQKNMSNNDLIKLMFIRSLLREPELLIVDGMLDFLPEKDFSSIHSCIQSFKGTLIVTTQEEKIASLYDNRVVL